MPDVIKSKKINLFFNSFTDLNYLSPLLLIGKEYHKHIHLIFYFEDLKRPETKIFFQKRKDEILNFPFISEFRPFVAESKNELKKYLKSKKGAFVTTSPTFFQLKRNNLLKRKIFVKDLAYIIINYFGEGVRESFKNIDLLYLNSPIESQSLSPHKIRYGNPYWDLFVHQELNLSQYDDLKFDPGKKNILIPEIMQEGEKWFDNCFNYIQTNYSDEKHFWIKYRLKLPDRLVRNQKLEEKLSHYDNITYIYSPYFFTTINLLENCDDVVFTSNGSLIIMDCMASKANIIRDYGTPLQLFEINDYNTACDNYAEKGSEETCKLIYRMGDNSLTLISEVLNVLGI